jgi:hypothetical protein
LVWRWQRTDYHAEKATEVWSELMESAVILYGEDFNEAVFAQEAQVEACVQSLHAMGDILAQIINIVMLGGRFREDDVTLKRVARQEMPTELSSVLNAFIQSNEYSYVEAFCNTIKHRRLIPSDLRGEFGEGYRNEFGIRFNGFSYKGADYPETWASDIIDPYRTTIGVLVNEVGITINRLLQAQLAEA